MSPPSMTKQVLLMGVTYSMGGFIYGYDTGTSNTNYHTAHVDHDLGQISGFLEMSSFQQAFGEFDSAQGTYGLPALRSGFIVGAVGQTTSRIVQS